jgi:hypothetical protein
MSVCKDMLDVMGKYREYKKGNLMIYINKMNNIYEIE